ncbi:8271_t:CDS:1, partial [Scutellospora calospora]
SSLSSLKSNDSNYTKKKKKGKFKVVDNLDTENLKADSNYTKKKKKEKFKAVNNLDTENLKADIEQARI